MSGGPVLKKLPELSNKEISKEALGKVDIFTMQTDNMPCKECKKGQKDCICPDKQKEQDPTASPYDVEK